MSDCGISKARHESMKIMRCPQARQRLGILPGRPTSLHEIARLHKEQIRRDAGIVDAGN